jgi:hypothetical protein
METVDVSDLPEPYAQAVKVVAETFRRQLAGRGGEPGKGRNQPPVELPRWPLGVIGVVSREEIYDDRV